MKRKSQNHYEKAFENWLKDNHIKYTAIDQSKRAAFGKVKLKSFDYLLYPADKPAIICEIKGRTFKGTSFENLTGLECWVSADDVDGLVQWQRVLGVSGKAYFIFVYKIENVDVDFDGREVLTLDEKRYVFLAVALDDYRKNMKLRSPKWRTVTLPADKYRKYAVGLERLLLYI